MTKKFGDHALDTYIHATNKDKRSLGMYTVQHKFTLASNYFTSVANARNFLKARIPAHFRTNVECHIEPKVSSLQPRPKAAPAAKAFVPKKVAAMKAPTAQSSWPFPVNSKPLNKPPAVDKTVPLSVVYQGFTFELPPDISIEFDGKRVKIGKS